MNKRERPNVRTMKIIRAWLPSGQFKYFAIYSDGAGRESSRKEAEQYKRATGLLVETVLDKPYKEDVWNTTGNSS